MILHVTDLDSLIWFKKIETMSVQDMRGRLLRTQPPNDAMRKGTAWHSVLENPPNEIIEVKRDGFIFKVMCDATIKLPQIREIRANKRYMIDDIEIVLTGGTDGVTGNKITDHKLTFKPNPDTYFDSYQWRAYLDIYNADIFEYIIYSAKETDNEITIYDISSLFMYRYPEMENDLIKGIRDLVEFCKEHVPEKL